MQRAGFTLIELLVVEPPWTPQLNPVIAPVTVDSVPVFVCPSDPGKVINQDSNNQDSNGDLYAGGKEMVMAAVANRTDQAGPTVADQRTATSTLGGRESAATRQSVSLSLSTGGWTVRLALPNRGGSPLEVSRISPRPVYGNSSGNQATLRILHRIKSILRIHNRDSSRKIT